MIHGTRNLFTVIFLLSTTKLPFLCSLFSFTCPFSWGKLCKFRESHDLPL